MTDDDANETLQLTVEEKRALIRLLKRTIGTSPRSAESDPRQAGTAHAGAAQAEAVAGWRNDDAARKAAMKRPAAFAPATLGSVVGRRSSAPVWCKDCRHQVEPDVAAQAHRYGAETTIPDCAKRLVCSREVVVTSISC